MAFFLVLPVHACFDDSSFFMSIFELEEYLPDIDACTDFAPLLGTLVPVQES